MKNRQRIIKSLLVLLLSFISILTFAQIRNNPTDSIPDDPATIYVYKIQDLKFGAFTQGTTGGTVVISNGGSRSVTGTVLALNIGITYFQAIFDIIAVEGSNVNIELIPDVTLNGNNGGTMSLHIGNSSPSMPFSTSATPPMRTSFNFGGTLTVGNSTASPPGIYSGSFSITFVQE